MPPTEGCRLPSRPQAPPVSRWPVIRDAGDPLPSLRRHYPTSALLRRSPPQCLALVLSPRGFSRLCFSLDIKALVPAVPRKSLLSDSRPLYAGRRLPRNQAPDRLVPEMASASGFDDIKIFNDASSRVHFRSSFGHSPAQGLALNFLLQRSPPWLFTAAAWSGLRPAPESRSRGARPHLSRSFTTVLHLLSFRLCSTTSRNVPDPRARLQL